MLIGVARLMQIIEQRVFLADNLLASKPLTALGTDLRPLFKDRENAVVRNKVVRPSRLQVPDCVGVSDSR